jgi:TrmH family RNA methyltransferase
MITSTANPKVKYVRRLLADRRFREREQAFVVEGTRWLDELVQAGHQPGLVFVTEAWLKDEGNDERLRGFAPLMQQVSDQVMKHTSDTETPPGILAVAPIKPQPLPEDPTLLLILDRLANPGNLGTILRTAAAAGADGVLLAPGCVDAYNPKVVRGAMGAHLRLALMTASWPQIEEQTAHMSRWLAAAGGDVSYDAVDWCQPSALIIGSEASGAGRAAQSLASRRVSIPMYRSTESLNAAVAAGIILFEAVRQRRAQAEGSPT